MLNANDVEKLALDLHDKGVLNLDTPLRDLLKPKGIGAGGPNNPTAHPEGVIVWGHYLLVHGEGQTAPADDLIKAAKTVQE